LKKKIKTDVTELQPIELGSDINNAVDVLTKLPDPIPKNTNITSFQHPILIGSQAARYHFPSFQNPIDWNIIATPSQAINWLNSLKTKHKTETKMVYYKNICIKIQLKCTINNVKGIEDIYNYNIEVVIGPHDMKEILNQKSSSIITIPAVAVTPICQSHNPLTGPSRSLDVETMLKSHINEMEKIYGVPIPSAQIKNDLVITKFIKHDDIHELIKYGERLTCVDLKLDQKSLFQQISYETQLRCVKEEAIVLSLERYLITQLALSQENAYKLSLSYICTISTKNWLRQFVIDYYPRLIRCGKDLMSIAQ
ncbi:5400_t:CDS:2, partial [Entrophospora sp. SA101]